MFDMFPTTNLVSLSLNESHKYQLYSLTAIFEQRHENGSVEEITVPKIELPCNALAIYIEHDSGQGTDFIDLGFGQMEVLPNENGKKFITRTIKEADPKELTMAEIEAKLGYPVKIVKEK